MRNIRPINVTDPDFTVIQGAYTLCCAAVEESTRAQEGNKQWNCKADFVLNVDFMSNSPSSGSISLGQFFAPSPEYVTDTKGEDWLKFQRLVQQWRIERGVRSSITETVIMPAYQEIVGMGLTALPFLIAQLKSDGDDPDQWFWALRAITGVNPVKEEHQGNFQEMARAWIQWAEVYAW